MSMLWNWHLAGVLRCWGNPIGRFLSKLYSHLVSLLVKQSWLATIWRMMFVALSKLVCVVSWSVLANTVPTLRCWTMYSQMLFFPLLLNCQIGYNPSHLISRYFKHEPFNTRLYVMADLAQ